MATNHQDPYHRLWCGTALTDMPPPPPEEVSPQPVANDMRGRNARVLLGHSKKSTRRRIYAKGNNQRFRVGNGSVDVESGGVTESRSGRLSQAHTVHSRSCFVLQI